MKSEPRRFVIEIYFISCPSETLKNCKRRLAAKWLSVLFAIISSSLNPLHSSPFKYRQTHLGTIKKEIAKNSAACCILLPITFGTSWVKSHPPHSFGSAFKSRNPSNTYRNCLCPGTSAYCVKQQATKPSYNIDVPPCRWVPSHQLKE